VIVSGILPLKQVEPVLGWTRDISPQGVYFVFQRRLKVGTKFNLSILFPKVSINGQASVVRAERKKSYGEQVGIAARIENPEVVRTKSKT